MSVRQVDKTNTFQANTLLRTNAVRAIQKLLPEEAKVKHVESCGYITFDSPWPIKTDKKEPPLAYMHAKEAHDRVMEEYATRFPEWRFDIHKGEGTPEHRRLILSKRAGSKVHRRSFMPLARFHAGGKKTDRGFIATKKKR
jgi:ribonuclease HII